MNQKVMSSQPLLIHLQQLSIILRIKTNMKFLFVTAFKG